MPKHRNFSIVVPTSELQAYVETVLDAGEKAGVPFNRVSDENVKGNTEEWRVWTRVGHGRKRRKISISGYTSGSVNFQGIHPIDDLKLDATVVNSW